MVYEEKKNLEMNLAKEEKEIKELPKEPMIEVNSQPIVAQ